MKGVVSMDIIMFLFFNAGWAAHFQNLDTIVSVEILLITKTMFMEKMQSKGIVILREINILAP